MVNMLAAFVQGQAAGQGQRDRRTAEHERSQLNALAPQIIGGDPGAFAQAAAINPEAAGQYQQSGDAIVRRARGAAKYLRDAVQAGDPGRIAAANRAIKPFMDTLSPGNAYPEEWDPGMTPNLDAFLAKTAYIEQPNGATGVQSTYVDEAGNRVAIMRDGTTQVLGRNNASIRILEQEGQLPYGVVTGGGAAGQVVPLGQGMGGGGQPQAPQRQSAPVLQQGQGQQLMDQIAASANQMIAAGIPADQVDAWAAQQMGGGTIREGGGNQLQTTQAVVPMQAAAAPLPPALDYANGGSVGPVRVPTSAERAAAETAARQATELSFLPQRGQIEAENAALREGAVQRTKADVDREAGRGKAQLSLQQATARLSRVDDLVRSIEPRINATTAGWLGGRLSSVDGTPAADLRRDLGTLQAIAGFDELNAMRASSPTGGALGNVTERELAFLQSVVRNIENSQSPDQLRRNLADFQREVRQSWDRVRDAYERDYGQGNAGGGGQSAAATGTSRRARNPQTGEVLELRDGQWVPAR